MTKEQKEKIECNFCHKKKDPTFLICLKCFREMEKPIENYLKSEEGKVYQDYETLKRQAKKEVEEEVREELREWAKTKIKCKKSNFTRFIN